MNFQFDSEWEGLQDARLLAEMQVVGRFFIYGNFVYKCKKSQSFMCYLLTFTGGGGDNKTNPKY